MAKFQSNSRYVKHSHAYHSIDREGRSVLAIAPAALPPQKLLGNHRLTDGERLDHLASFYLKDATAFWRIVQINDCIVPDAVLARTAIDIPDKD